MILAYIGFILALIGIVTGTCTMGSVDELIMGIIFSAPFYIGAFLQLYFTKSPRWHLLLSIPFIPLILWNLYWSIGLFINTNIQGNAACSWKIGDNFGSVSEMREYYISPYFLVVCVAFLLLILRLFIQLKKRED